MVILLLLWRAEGYHQSAVGHLSPFIHECRTYYLNSRFDWIYIDTTHSYELTRDELHGYANKIKPDGIIAGHDYMQGNWHAQCRYGVIEAVHEFCVTKNYRIRYLTMDISESLSFAIEKNN
ncbi:class I SAM-dependent methyltransferase [Aeromonas caviae]|uniref:class I SAM-dependent methyltransferase n=1 Tax=Aeromonas caviae TaxID=648 RepID=UPI0015DEA66B|nr:class I SAM-dependent methyltransferase [Aeromonas caviae]QLL84250.1 hypothetical protein GWG05_07975 [Aeromonas caviae]